jgi:curved DNA-binding protein CbpA
LYCGGGIVSYYVILGVPQNADEATIRHAFRALARRHHPDAGAGSNPERFRQIVNAYETLSDPVRRQAYDRSLADSRANKAPFKPPVEPMVRNQWAPAMPSRHAGMRPPVSFYELIEEMDAGLFQHIELLLRRLRFF